MCFLFYYEIKIDTKKLAHLGFILFFQLFFLFHFTFGIKKVAMCFQ